MGAITFLSRKDHHELDNNHHIYETGSHDDLTAYHRGDSVEIYFHVPEAFFERFQAQRSPGLRCYDTPDTDAPGGERYNAILGFTVTGFLHALSRESRENLLLSEVIHRVFLEPETDLAEDALVWILDYLKPTWLVRIDAEVDAARDTDVPGAEETR